MTPPLDRRDVGNLALAGGFGELVGRFGDWWPGRRGESLKAAMRQLRRGLDDGRITRDQLLVAATDFDAYAKAHFDPCDYLPNVAATTFVREIEEGQSRFLGI